MAWGRWMMRFWGLEVTQSLAMAEERMTACAGTGKHVQRWSEIRTMLEQRRWAQEGFDRARRRGALRPALAARG